MHSETFWLMISIVNQDAQFDAASMEQEVAIMKKVNHPNCIKLHEVTQASYCSGKPAKLIEYQVYDEKSKMYLVMDLVTGGELFDRIVARGHYTELDAAQLMVQCLEAIG
jgi:calcium/calmodulin-dependent protein kinase I